MKTRPSLLTLVLLGAASTALVALDIPYANKGTDGAFNPTGATYTVNLALAQTSNWDTVPTVAGRGVYDPQKWAVVFKFTSINIPSNTIVRFANHPSRAPVVWLVDGDVNISGSVNLDGPYSYRSSQYTVELSEPGPGGFRGGDAISGQYSAGGGLGPGGGNVSGPASYGTPSYYGGQTYGNERIIPLIGGSGGGGSYQIPELSGSAGGGAILLAASGTVTLSGSILARGGNSENGAVEGSGGACRIIADQIAGSGLIDVRAIRVGAAGDGRLRLESFKLDPQLRMAPASYAVSPLPVQLWPEASQPIARIASVSGLNAPSDPRAFMQYGLPADVSLAPGSRTNVIVVETSYLPTNAVVITRIVPRNGYSWTVTNDFLSTTGDPNVLRWSKTVVLPPGYHAMQVRATAP